MIQIATIHEQNKLFSVFQEADNYKQEVILGNNYENKRKRNKSCKATKIQTKTGTITVQDKTM